MFDRREYMKQWRASHSEKLKEKNRKFYAENKNYWNEYRKSPDYKEKCRKWRTEHPTHSKDYYQKNRTRLLALAKKNYYTKKSLPANTITDARY